MTNTELLVNLKVYEYLGKALAASICDDRIKMKSAAKMLVILYRRQSRATIQKFLDESQQYHDCERSLTKAKKAGVIFPFGEGRVEQLNKQRMQTRDQLVEIGNLLCSALDTWQACGASLEDLCNLCNRDYHQVLKEIGTDQDRAFSELVFLYNLDFKSELGFLSYEVDAPLTHAVKDYYIETLIRSPEGMAASREVLMNCYPELWENARKIVTDEEGNEYYIDRDGEIQELGH